MTLAKFTPLDEGGVAAIDSVDKYGYGDMWMCEIAVEKTDLADVAIGKVDKIDSVMRE